MEKVTRTVRIANSSGFWGDDPQALSRLINGPLQLDYITMDFLAEISMGILRKQQKRNADLGYAAAFVDQIGPHLPQILSKKIKIICNAGGLNPQSCAKALKKIADQQKLSPKIALVTGDDVLPQLTQGDAPARKLFDNLDTGESLDKVQKDLCAANAYLSARAIAQALSWNPDIVITGRVIDAGLTLGPLIHEFAWESNAWDKLAAGICAGHLIECGAQVCGGNFTDYHKIISFSEIGFPIVECQSDGTFIITKQLGSGGLVSVETVKEQLLYEVGDPSAYIVADCVADFASAELKQVGDDRVQVSNLRGAVAPNSYKVSASYNAGFRFSHGILVGGTNVRAKARIFRGILKEKMKACGLQEDASVLIEAVGDNAVDPDQGTVDEPQEIILRISAWHSSPGPLELLREMIPSLILAGPPGVAVLGGNPNVSEVMGFWPCLIDKLQVPVQLSLLIDGVEREQQRYLEKSWPQLAVSDHRAESTKTVAVRSRDLLISEIAFARSGDKGDKANIAVFARGDWQYKYLLDHLTAEDLRKLMPSYCSGKIICFEAPRLQAVNFLIDKALPGGGALNLRIDPQGKTLAQTLLKRRI